MSVELGRRLLASGAVGQAELRAALLRHILNGQPFVRVLLELGHLTESALEAELSRSELPTLHTVLPLPAIVEELPEGLCAALLAVPVRRDPRTGLVDVATVDPYDWHVAEEFGYHTKSEVRLLRASLLSVDQALSRIAQGEYSSTVILRTSTLPPRNPGPGASGPPIPLVRKAVRDGAVEVLGVRDIVEQMEGDAALTDELGEPILPLRSARVPRAPSVPSLEEGPFATVPPTTARGPFSPRAPSPPFADIGSILEAIERAHTRDEILDCLIVGMSTVARRVGLFSVKKDCFRGVACNDELGESEAFRHIEIPSDTPTVLATALDRGSYLGPLPATAPHEPLLRFMKQASNEVAAVLVRIAGRAALVVFADELGDSMISTRKAEELGREAGHAFSRLMAETKGRKADA